MFNIEGKKSYRVIFINGGVSSKHNPYTFITAEDEPVGNAKYGDKIKLNIWGVDLSSQIKKDDYIKILGAREVGIVRNKAKEGDKWYENLTIVCGESDVVLGDKPAQKQPKEQPTEMVEIGEQEFLPF